MGAPAGGYYIAFIKTTYYSPTPLFHALKWPALGRIIRTLRYVTLPASFTQAFAFGVIIAAAVAVETLNTVNDFLDGGSVIGDDLGLIYTRITAGWIIFVGISAIVIMALFIFFGITSRRKKIAHAIVSY